MSVIPRATYRVQLHRDFDFRAARRIVPYLAELGISHLYTSPFLKARTGSLHGYDIVDHQSLNPEIGSEEDFDALVDTLHEHDMQLMIDVVPNHMGVLEADNRWWLDVLEHGPTSRFARYFDIDWEPLSEELCGKVLLPILGAQYGTVLERGELKLVFDREVGAFNLWYYEHRMPVSPRTYPAILQARADPGGPQQRVTPEQRDNLQELAEAFALLGGATADGRDAGEGSEPLKQRLAALYAEVPALRERIDANVRAMNGVAGNALSFDRLHALIKEQFYRVSYWRVAADDINYRRFFDINGLAALRAEQPEVFEATHRRIFEWVAERKVDALRIDHPDGLLDPVHYCAEVQRRAAAVLDDTRPTRARDKSQDLAIYLVLEKILADHEKLAESWPVHGTTGYRFMNVVNGLFVDVDARRRFDRLYAAFIAEQPDFDRVLRESKTLIAVHSLASDLNLLATALTRIAKSRRDTCDFTLNSLRRALVDIVACFPVYRTYVTPGHCPSEARRYIEWAVGVAKRVSAAAETSGYDFVRDILIGARPVGSEALQNEIDRFVGRFQQFTAPVMAKGMEDTSFYIYDRLAALNEVGGDPRRFGFTLEAFHTASQDRARHWPHTMLATSTHDNKRSEDVRTRIDVLSEMPAEWRLALRRWRQLNRRLRQTIGHVHAPSRNDEYLLYQTLLGSWPLEPLNPAVLATYTQRIKQYMLKAAREAKVHTSWINPNAAYESALDGFVQGLLGTLAPNPFLADFRVAAARIARYGALNSLSQTLLKLTSPGVPDTYQGTELWELSLVDPDNRRPVDYARRIDHLHALKRDFTDDGDHSAAARMLLEHWTDGTAKLWLIWRVLALRRQHSQWFEKGGYVPLAVQGAKARHLCAFARPHDGGMLVILAPRLYVGLSDDGWPLGGAVWGDTRVRMAAGSPMDWRNALTGARYTVDERGMPIASILDAFPLALLTSE